MNVEINSKSKGIILYRNVSGIDTSIDFNCDEELPKLVYSLTLKQANHFEDIILDDVTSFTVLNNRMTWIDIDTDTIQCPHCNVKFKKILFDSIVDGQINFCPACSEYTSYEDYIKDVVEID